MSAVPAPAICAWGRRVIVVGGGDSGMADATKPSSEHPKCFLHLPKCGGQSIHEALTRALPPGAVSRLRHDGSNYAGFTAFDQLTGWARETWAHTDADLAEMRQARIVSGHFGLGTLLRVAPASAIATVLREPRVRLLSLYGYWRLTPWLYDQMSPYTAPFDAARKPLAGFLDDPAVAQEIDNHLCRALLHGERDISPTTFIDAADHAAIAHAAIGRLDTLGLVGILELGDRLWPQLAQFFGLPLEPTRANVTGSGGLIADHLPSALAITPRTFELLEARSAADAIVYEHVLARSGHSQSEAAALRAAALAEGFVRFGDLAGHSAARAEVAAGRVAATEAGLEEARRQLAESRALAEQAEQTIDGLHAESAELRTRIADSARVIEWLARDGRPLIALRGRLRAERERTVRRLRRSPP